MISMIQIGTSYHQKVKNGLQAKDFISKLLIVNPSKRLTSEEALKHPFLFVKPEVMIAK